MNILLPVSIGSSFPDALSLATEIAKAHEGKIRILYVVDQDELDRIEEGAPPGAIHLAQHAAEEVEKRMTAEGAEAVREAKRACEQAGVPVIGEVREGVPEREIVGAAGGCDLLVGGIGSHFAPGLEDAPGKLVLSVMKDGGIPVVLACTPVRPVRTVVIGCGGGIRSERSVGAMTRLSLWKKGCRVILLAVDDNPEEGEARLATPRKLLAEAGYPPWEERVIPGSRLEAFPEFCETERADAIVLGGWGEHWWHNLLGRSITGYLLEEGRYILFLYM
jgi:nucleotide-binding universal stress UspA family protein